MEEYVKLIIIKNYDAESKAAKEIADTFKGFIDWTFDNCEPSSSGHKWYVYKLASMDMDNCFLTSDELFKYWSEVIDHP